MTPLRTLRSLPAVRRAWPAADGTLTFESTDADGRLRAGRITLDGRVELAPFGTDSKLPALRTHLEGRLVVHRLGRRAVVLASERAIKLVRPGRAAAVAQASARIADLSEGTGLSAATVLAATDSRVDFALLPGQTLHRLASTGLSGWKRFVESWPRLVTRRPVLPAHTGIDEARVLWQWYDRAWEHRALPQLEVLRPLVEEACLDLAADSGPEVMVHRDLHDKQLLWDGAQLGLLDLDTAARGEAALDLGNLWVHVELRGVQGSWPAPFRRQVIDLLRGLTDDLPTTPARLRAYYRAARLRLAFVYAFRPSPWLPQWVSHCLDPVEQF